MRILPDLGWASSAVEQKNCYEISLNYWLNFFLPSEGLRNGAFPAISVNKDVTVISDSALQCLKALKEENTCDLAAISWVLRNSDCKKQGILAPDSWDAYGRNDFSEPRILDLPIHRKVLNSLTWDIWFSLTIIFLMFWLPALCCLLDFYITWLLLLPHQSFLSRLLELLSPGFETLKIPTG